MKKPEILRFPPLGHIIAAGGGSLILICEGTYPLADFVGLWLLFYYLDKRENDFTILAGRGNDFTVSVIGTCYGAVTIIHKIAKELTMGYN